MTTAREALTKAAEICAVEGIRLETACEPYRAAGAYACRDAIIALRSSVQEEPAARAVALLKRATAILKFHAGRCPIAPNMNYSGGESHCSEYRAVQSEIDAFLASTLPQSAQNAELSAAERERLANMRADQAEEALASARNDTGAIEKAAKAQALDDANEIQRFVSQALGYPQGDFIRDAADHVLAFIERIALSQPAQPSTSEASTLLQKWWAGGIDNQAFHLRMKAALSESVQPKTSEPVAWRYRYGPKGMWKYADDKADCNPSPNYEQQPLYLRADGGTAKVPEFKPSENDLYEMARFSFIPGEMMARLIGILEICGCEIRRQTFLDASELCVSANDKARMLRMAHPLAAAPSPNGDEEKS